MTDRELLEKAAKALGWEFMPAGTADKNHAGWFDRKTGSMYWCDTWNPLSKDGDRYRLARDLGMCLDFYLGQVRIDGRLMQSFDPRNEIEEAYAIVRAAAAIGEAMP